MLQLKWSMSILAELKIPKTGSPLNVRIHCTWSIVHCLLFFVFLLSFLYFVIHVWRVSYAYFWSTLSFFSRGRWMSWAVHWGFGSGSFTVMGYSLIWLWGLQSQACIPAACSSTVPWSSAPGLTYFWCSLPALQSTGLSVHSSGSCLDCRSWSQKPHGLLGTVPFLLLLLFFSDNATNLFFFPAKTVHEVVKQLSQPLSLLVKTAYEVVQQLMCVHIANGDL